MKECKHPTCGEHCRRPKKEKKVYVLKRTPIKKKSKKIKPVSDKRKAQNKLYSIAREYFLQRFPKCQIQSPECTGEATEVHHTNGRENERLLDERFWKSSCRNCNGYVERFSQWAYDNGHKLHKHQTNNGYN